MSFTPYENDVRKQMGQRLPYRFYGPGYMAGLKFVQESEAVWHARGKFIPGSFDHMFSILASLTYDPVFAADRERLVQAILDAYSPFQFVSKTLAVDLVMDAIVNQQIDVRETILVHIGSWFGQIAALTTGVGKGHILVDKDPLCGEVQRRLFSLLVPNSERFFSVRTVDVQDFIHPGHSLQAKQDIVTWTGLEHFDPSHVQQYVKSAPDHTTYVFMATDMPAPDHICPYDSADAILEMLADLPMQITRKGAIKTEVGNRYFVVAQTNNPF